MGHSQRAPNGIHVCQDEASLIHLEPSDAYVLKVERIRPVNPGELPMWARQRAGGLHALTSPTPDRESAEVLRKRRVAGSEVSLVPDVHTRQWLLQRLAVSGVDSDDLPTQKGRGGLF